MKTFKKTEKQKEAIQLISKKEEVLFTGSARSGKTFICTYALFVRALKEPNTTHIIVRKFSNSLRRAIWGQTINDVLRICFPDLKQHCHVDNTQMVITLPNGSKIMCMGCDNAQQMDKILGIECSTFLVDEITEIKQEQYETLITRLAEKSELQNRIMCCCNPTTKSSWIFKRFIPSGNYMKIHISDNLENVAKSFMKQLEKLSERKRKRFLDAEWISDIEGALWNADMIELCHTPESPQDFERIVIGVDPAVTTKTTSDLTGIVVCGKLDDLFYVLEDKSGKYTPKELSSEISSLWYKYDADLVKIETNQGGDYVIDNIKQYDSMINVKGINHRKSKIVRAEPISYLYEKNLVKHIHEFSELAC